MQPGIELPTFHTPDECSTTKPLQGILYHGVTLRETLFHRITPGRHSTTQPLHADVPPRSHYRQTLYHRVTPDERSTTEQLRVDALPRSHSVRMLYHGNGMCEVLVLVGVGWSTLPLRIATTLPKMCGPVLISSCSVLFKKDNANTHNISSIFIFICLILIIP